MRDVTLGSLLGGYRVEAELGRGGMGVVYRAVQPRLERPVALKVLGPDRAGDPAFRERFTRESSSAASLDHPHVLPVYQAGEDEGVLFLAMRLVEGPDLATILRRTGPLEPGRAVRLLEQLASALDAAHSAGLVHRDVKPANVLVDDQEPSEHAYLTDFGLTKRSNSQTGMTGTGQWVGTLDYVAPEQIRGDPVNAAADIYALGCLFFELLTGRPPHRRETDVATIWAHISELAPAPSSIDPQLPQALDAVVATALAKEPAERPESAGEFARTAVAALENSTGRPQPTDRTTGRPAAPDRHPRRSTSSSPGTGGGVPVGAVSGLAGVAVLTNGYYVLPPPQSGYLPPDPTGAELIAYFTTDRAIPLIEAALLSVSAALLGVFLWFLPRLLGYRGDSGWARVFPVLAAGSIGAQLLAEVLRLAPSFRLARDQQAENLVLSLWNAGNTVGIFNSVLTGLAALVATVLGLRVLGRRSVLPWACLAGAAGSAASAVGEATDSPLASVGLAVITLWVVIVAVTALVRVAPATTRRWKLFALGGTVPTLFLPVSQLVPLPETTVVVDSGTSAEDLALYYTEIGPAAIGLSALSVVAFVLGFGLWWALWVTCRPTKLWAGAGFGAGIFYTVLGVGAGICQMIAVLASNNPSTVKVFDALSLFGGQIGALAVCVAIGLFGAALLLCRAEQPPWLGWAGIATAVIAAVGPVVLLISGDNLLQLNSADNVVVYLWAWVAAFGLLVRSPASARLQRPGRPIPAGASP